MSKLVSAEEALAVAKKMFNAETTKLVDYAVEQGTTTVQGFMSDILRVNVRVKVGDGETKHARFVVKRQPKLKSQQKVANESGIFEHEIAFFEKCVPLLLEQCPELPVVRCFLTDQQRRIIYMEDLTDADFCTIISNAAEISANVVKMKHARKVVETLAIFHSASVGINFYERFPEMFEKDPYFESSGGRLMRVRLKNAVDNTLMPIAQHYLDKRFVKCVEWMASDDFYNTAVSLCKPAEDRINVLCHGDCWANNMMFKINPRNGNIQQIKMIDFQLTRYAALDSDIVYFLYSFSAEFRDKNKKELLELYWNTFSAECAKKKIKLDLSLEKFCCDYEKDRLFGLLFTAVYRPRFFVRENLPQGDNDLTQKQMTAITGRSPPDPNKAVEEFKNNNVYREVLISIFTELEEFYEHYCGN